MGGQKWSNVSPVLRPQMAGGFADGVNSVHSAMQAVLNAKRPVQVPDAPIGSFYALSATVGFPSGARVTAEGYNACFKALPGSTADPLLFGVYNAASDIQIQGLIFDGNRPNVPDTGANKAANVVTNYQCSTVIYRRCKWLNTRGIAAIFTRTVECGIVDCDFLDCGTLNRTTGVDADRKQGVAFGGGSDNYVKDSRFTGIGLDMVALGGGSIRPKVTNNRFIDTNAAAIYNAGTIGALISLNTILGQTSGNGIDNFGVKGTTISACVINGCGAGGILWAGDCTDCNAVGCLCKNNVKSPTTTLHRGGITFHFSAGSTMRSVTLTGNICVDDQGPGAVSQFYAIGVVDDGGARSDISIDESNILRGYRLDGVENEQYIFERPLKVLTAFPQYVILDDQGEFFICSGSATCWATITQINNSQYAIVAPRTSNSPGKLLDTGNGYTTGTGYAGVTNTAVYRDATTNAVIARNMTGGPKAYRFALMQKR